MNHMAVPQYELIPTITEEYVHIKSARTMPQSQPELAKPLPSSRVKTKKSKALPRFMQPTTISLKKDNREARIEQANKLYSPRYMKATSTRV